MKNSSKNTNIFFLILGSLALFASIYQFSNDKIFLGVCAVITGSFLAFKGYKGLQSK